jgi:putative membrane protein
MKRPIIVLCIDRDNDLFDKGGVPGPLIGREKNLQGAISLSLADPEDPDSNAMFYAIKLYDQLNKEGNAVEVVTLTGDRKLGVTADRIVSAQLDRVLLELNPTSCILVSDGVADEEVLPIIKSRIKVDYTKIVFIKQAKELEKTYFVVLEKLKDPYFARTIIGVPAILLLLISLSSFFGLGWQPIGVLIGIYLVLKIMGFEDMILDFISDFRFSFERASWVGYVGAMAIFCIGLFIGYQSAVRSIAMGLTNEKIFASVAGSVVWITYIGSLMVLVGKTIDALMDKKKYYATKYFLYAAAGALITIVIVLGSQWIVNISEPYVDFGTFLLSIVFSIVAGYFITRIVHWYRKELLKEMKLEGKEAVSDHGSYLGKIIGFDLKRDRLIIQSVFDKKFTLPLTSISSVDEKVVVKSEE